jgi:TolB-like protein/class 3 adenylate cyclase/Tfp pilus assembly protein PilF
MDATSRILTLVFTDLVQSTALKTQQGDRAVGVLLARHRAHVERLAGGADGRIVAWAGDGCFLTFDRPSAAVTFALGLEHAHGADQGLPAVRVGIHMGEVTERPDRPGHLDVEGLAVDLAARIAAIAGPGQILISGAVYETVRARLEATAFDHRVRLHIHGRYAVKGIDTPVEIAEVGFDGRSPFTAPEATDKATPVLPSAAARRPPTWAWLAIALLVAGVGFLAVRFMRPLDGGENVARQPIASLAVLPFRNFSHDPEQEYFVDGMTEALITELAKIKSLKVISRTSAMHYKGTDKPLPEVARELGIDGIVEGSVYKSGNEVRITAQLIRGATDEHLWSESYTESLENVLRLQAKVALAISDEIQATLSANDRRRLQSPRVVVPVAHEALLKGMHAYNLGSTEGLTEAGGYLREAIKLDPGNAEAYVYLANLSILPSVFGLGPGDPAIARALAHEALRLDPDNAGAHTVLGWLSYMFEWDWERAEAEFRLATEIDPSVPWAYQGRADLLVNTGRFEEALAAAGMGLERDPLSAYTNWEYAFILWGLRRYDESIARYTRSLELAPDMAAGMAGAADAYWAIGKRDNALEQARTAVTLEPNPSNRAYLAYRLALAGETTEARQIVDQALADAEHAFVTPAYVAWALSALGDDEGALAWAERGVDARDYFALTINWWPQWDPLRGNPRFQALHERMRFPKASVETVAR